MPAHAAPAAVLQWLAHVWVWPSTLPPPAAAAAAAAAAVLGDYQRWQCPQRAHLLLLLLLLLQVQG
jgi:hypothetical protein